MNSRTSMGRWCVIGAGPSGLAVARHLSAAGIDYECLEGQDQLGGNWYFDGSHSSVCHSTHLISSARMTEYPDFPMPDDFPPYPRHDQVLRYLNDYADHFQLRGRIEFNALVESARRVPGGWAVAVRGEAAPRHYTGLIVANGHHWDPIVPDWAAGFRGELLTARDYKRPEQLRGRRVLVVGAGNSGCDLAVEAAQHGTSCALSMRRGYYFLPKFLCGLPVDVAGKYIDRFRPPAMVRRWVAQLLLRIAVGPIERYGLPRPDHRLFETHPIVNSQLLQAIGHGRVSVRPDVRAVIDDCVEFTDGRREQFDLIVLATGYRVSFPFLDPEELHARQGLPQLFLHAFHPERDDVMVAGMIQPNGGLWPLTDAQAQLIARYIVARHLGLDIARRFAEAKRAAAVGLSGGIHFDRSPRHRLEVDYFAYLRACRAWISRFDRQVGPAGWSDALDQAGPTTTLVQSADCD